MILKILQLLVLTILPGTNVRIAKITGKCNHL